MTLQVRFSGWKPGQAEGVKRSLDAMERRLETIPAQEAASGGASAPKDTINFNRQKPRSEDADIKLYFELSDKGRMLGLRAATQLLDLYPQVKDRLNEEEQARFPNKLQNDRDFKLYNPLQSLRFAIEARTGFFPRSEQFWRENTPEAIDAYLLKRLPFVTSHTELLNTCQAIEKLPDADYQPSDAVAQALTDKADELLQNLGDDEALRTYQDQLFSKFTSQAKLKANLRKALAEVRSKASAEVIDKVLDTAGLRYHELKEMGVTADKQLYVVLSPNEYPSPCGCEGYQIFMGSAKTGELKKLNVTSSSMLMDGGTTFIRTEGDHNFYFPAPNNRNLPHHYRSGQLDQTRVDGKPVKKEYDWFTAQQRRGWF